ncbi:helix-turn-helix domain-containing protein [Streptomyces sp. NPDC008343]|uniref:helix-turn-helix domain-containing protein n=1 Tax=Streptomyces sp. NPDC008343 TaxID=3364828 RepID=UPI0036E75CDF
MRSRRWGTALRRNRLAASIDQPQAAEIIASSQARISRVETGHATPCVIEVRLLLDAYGVKDPEVRAKLVEVGRAEVQFEARAEGRVRAVAEDILRILAVRGVEVPDAVRERVGACVHLDVLRLWRDRSVTVENAEELFVEE